MAKKTDNRKSPSAKATGDKQNLKDNKAKVAEKSSGGKKTAIKKNEEKKPLKSSVVSPKSSNEPQSMEELLSQAKYQMPGVKRGNVVEGTIVAISGKDVYINVGGKTEGVVYEKELPYIKDLLAELKTGDKVRCYVVLTEDDMGRVVLSLRRANLEKKWETLKDAYSKNESLEVKAVDTNKGGLLVDYKGLNGFIPSSQLDAPYSFKSQDLVNKILKVKAVEVDPKNNRLIFSQRQVSGGLRAEEIAKILDGMDENEKCFGKVTGVVPFGIFVTLEKPEKVKGLDGLVHISEIAWEKVENPSDYYKVGDGVEVVILGVERKSGKLNLSLKKLLPDPWQDLAKMYQKDQYVKGKVTKVSDFGVFVELEKGIEGLLHVSKIPSDTKFSAGDKIECVIEIVDPVKHRISLSLLPTEKPIGYK
ncbi:MAG: S1 RNA-binding domain-containing protein [Patescibacteria group bacterium]|nr:S1 RNA-binding domain-containing protein [Patescibacteria group bacterium]